MFNLRLNVVATDDRIRLQINEQGFSSFRATPGSAAYDLHACGLPGYSYTVLEPGETRMIDTGLSVHISSPGFCALIVPRSGTASKKKLAPINSPGLIDSDYQGPLKIALHNFGDAPASIEDFERVAQLLFIPCVAVTATLVEAHEVATARAEGGFGSTGA